MHLYDYILDWFYNNNKTAIVSDDDPWEYNNNIIVINLRYDGATDEFILVNSIGFTCDKKTGQIFCDFTQANLDKLRKYDVVISLSDKLTTLYKLLRNVRES